MEERKE